MKTELRKNPYLNRVLLLLFSNSIPCNFEPSHNAVHMVESHRNIPSLIVRKHQGVLLVLVLIVAAIFVLHRNYVQFKSTVSIWNPRWQKVHIQVGKRYNADTIQEKLIFDQYLVKGQSRTFTIDDSYNIVYRRNLDPTMLMMCTLRNGYKLIVMILPPVALIIRNKNADF